jgi:hypothetical protein
MKGADMGGTSGSSRLLGPFLALVLATAGLTGGVGAQQEALDPAHNLPIPCEFLSTPGSVPRSAKNIAHLANVCGFVGTDIEFQSRVDAQGRVRDFAFVGTMGAGTRIFDITDPASPRLAGGYVDPGWQNDVQVRGDVLILAFDWLVAGAKTSVCMHEKGASVAGAQKGGVDVVRLDFDPVTATFATSLLGCYLSSINTGGAHTITIHPSGEWLSMNTSFAGIEVVDLRQDSPTFLDLVRHIPVDVVDQAHDVFFSEDGDTLYSAGIASTRIVDVTNVFGRAPTPIATIPNVPQSQHNPDGHTIQISHQSDVSSDGRILVVTDERGGGLSQTACNTNPNGVIGGAHFWALEEIDGVAKSSGASPATPKKIGTWVYPNPTLAVDILDPVLAGLGRTERACTIHVFRNGGNGSASPGPIDPSFDGVSSLPVTELVTAHYGAGVWHLDFSVAPGPAEDSRTTWGNTLGWNVMPGADTWSAKEYKGFIYAGDMARGFDVYSFTECEGIGCVIIPKDTPGKATGGGNVLGGTLAELLIVSGTNAGGKANFGFNAEHTTGQVAPSGNLTFNDKASGKKVQATSVDSYYQKENTAVFSGTATVNGTAGVRYSVVVQDFGEPGTADTFRISLDDGYVAGGVLLNGNIKVHPPGG